MGDEVKLDLAAAADRAGLSVADLRLLVASGEIAGDDDRVATTAIVAWVEQDRATRRQALEALAAGIGDEVFY